MGIDIVAISIFVFFRLDMFNLQVPFIVISFFAIRTYRSQVHA